MLSAVSAIAAAVTVLPIVRVPASSTVALGPPFSTPLTVSPMPSSRVTLGR